MHRVYEPLKRLYNKYNLTPLQLDSDLTEEQLDLIGKFLHTRCKKLIQYRQPKTISELYNILLDALKYGTESSLEKYKVVYGEEVGAQKWSELQKKTKLKSTLEGYILKHGEEEGLKRWEEYRKKQAVSNTYEYKLAKGLVSSYDEFKEYNRSRASTKENMILRYGDVLGLEKWEAYCARQSYTKTVEYLGEERYKEVNLKKSNSLENYILRYGPEKGPELFDNFIQRAWSFHSKQSQRLFWTLYETPLFTPFQDTIYFAEKNNEYGVYDAQNKVYYKYDFVCIDLKLVIEYNGDHYHGNPSLYSPDDQLKVRGMKGKLVRDIWCRDQQKIDLIYKLRGFDTIVVWESDYLKSPDVVRDRIIKYAALRI